MMEYINKSIEPLSDHAILSLLGDFIRKTRLDQNKTQQQVADAAGLNRTTVVQIENGKGGTLLSFIQLLRALEKLPLLESFSVKQQISPLLLAEMEHQYRKRASGKQKPDNLMKSDW